MKILVLAGGLSPERDVSLSSASQIAKALISKGYNVCILDLAYGIEDIAELEFTDNIRDIEDYKISKNITAFANGKIIGANVIAACKKADAVYLALHGDVGENGKIQALLDLNDIKYTGSKYDGCCLAMDKNISKIIAKQYKVKTPKWSMNTKTDDIHYPCVVKPAGCGSSVGVAMVNTDAELTAAIHKAKQFDDTILIEERIIGREFSVGILDSQALPIIEIEPKSGFYDYENKYQPGMTMETCPANLTQKQTETLQKSALIMYKALHLGYYSRIDFMMDKDDSIYFLEANALPGMTPTSLLPQEAAAMEITYSDLCDRIVKAALKANDEDTNNTV
ncbi:MAG: D-alanine--D-alanine ligase [Clostridium sp.]|nr:D-alanine--D-alanine ligase [Clostridium sp.]